MMAIARIEGMYIIIIRVYSNLYVYKCIIKKSVFEIRYCEGIISYSFYS